jgi:hypothetical protein
LRAYVPNVIFPIVKNICISLLILLAFGHTAECVDISSRFMEDLVLSASGGSQFQMPLPLPMYGITSEGLGAPSNVRLLLVHNREWIVCWVEVVAATTSNNATLEVSWSPGLGINWPPLNIWEWRSEWNQRAQQAWQPRGEWDFMYPYGLLPGEALSPTHLAKPKNWPLPGRNAVLWIEEDGQRYASPAQGLKVWETKSNTGRRVVFARRMGSFSPLESHLEPGGIYSMKVKLRFGEKELSSPPIEVFLERPRNKRGK